MKTIVILNLLGLLLVGCASKKDKHEIRDRAKHSTVTNPQSLGDSIHPAIHASKSLTRDQKQELERIVAGNKKKAEELSADSFRFRSILVQELLSGKISEKKIRILKKEIRALEQQKLKNFLETIEKITSVVSKSPDKERFFEPLKTLDRYTR